MHSLFSLLLCLGLIVYAGFIVWCPKSRDGYRRFLDASPSSSRFVFFYGTAFAVRVPLPPSLFLLPLSPGLIRVAEDAALLRTRLDETSKDLESARDAITADETNRSREDGEDAAELESEVSRKYPTFCGNRREMCCSPPRGGSVLIGIGRR